MFENLGQGDEVGDGALISRVRAGDQSAFGTLYARHHAAAIRFASKLTFGTRTGADDAVAEAFSNTLKAIQGGKGPEESFRAYVYTVVRNAVMTANIRDSHSFTVDDFEGVERTNRTEYADPALTRFESATVRAAFASIPERWQSVLWYSEIEGLKPAEVAQLLGLSSHGVSMLRARAREGLKAAYLQAHLSTVEAGSTCADIVPKLGAYARKSIAARDRRSVESHLVDCADCAAMVAEVKDVNRGLILIIAPFILGGSSAIAVGDGGIAPAASTASVAPTVRTASTISMGTAASVAVAIVAVPLLVAAIVMVAPIVAGVVGSTNTVAEGVLQADPVPGKILPDRGDFNVAPAPVPSVTPTHKPTSTPAPGQTPSPSPTRSPSPSPTPSPAPASTVPPVPAQPVTPDPDPEPPAAPPNLLSNGGFDGSGYEAVNGSYWVGETFDGWKVDSANPGLQNIGMQIWYDATVAMPFTSGPYAGVQGTISQSVQTEAGRTYQLVFEHRSSADSNVPSNPGWQAGMSGAVSVDGVTLASFTTASASVHTPVTKEFTATSSSTLIEFSTATSIGLDNIFVSLLP